MRFLLLAFFFMFASPLMAFNVGPSSKSNFGSANRVEENEETPQWKTSFSATKYDPSRWNKAGQTRVDTTVVEETPQRLLPSKEKKPTTRNAKKAASADAQLPGKSPQTHAQKPEQPVQASAQATSEQIAIPAEAAAAMAQLGQIQSMVQGLSGMGGEAGGMPVGTETGGMPDLSKLLGGSAPSAPTTQPVKK